MNVLDTNVISELMRDNPHPAVLTWLDNQLASSLFVTAITETEILTGIAILPVGIVMPPRFSVRTGLARQLRQVERCVGFLAGP